MAYLIDTNIAIHAQDGLDSVLQKLAAYQGLIAISSLTLAELQRGLYKRPLFTALRQLRLATLLESVDVLPFDTVAAEAYGRIIAQVGWVKGRDFDRLIAAHAIAAHCVFVTANVADFSDVPGLSIENWAVPR